MKVETNGYFAQTAPTEEELKKIAEILKKNAGIVIAPGKNSMVQSRLQKRLRSLNITSYGKYIDFVCSPGGEDEQKEMISALTTNVTNFFRENHHFEIMREKILPDLIKKAKNGKKIRIWSAGCSNGQEAYSIAITIAEYEKNFQDLDIKILATDIDKKMIIHGSSAIYDEASTSHLDKKILKNYFEKASSGWKIIDSIKNIVSFKELNIHSDWPIRGGFDVIFCRNMMIYFSQEDQEILWKRFKEKMNPESWIFVGHSERINTSENFDLVPSGITAYKLKY